jgi:4-hydroxythreonine-4-phosphate dehydrogenase
MLFTCEQMSVLLATIHIPLKKVSAALKCSTVRSAVESALSFCRKRHGPDGWRIAVCGLNPHAGENGLLGSEEKRIIGPVVSEFRQRGEPVDGPLPADTVFFKARQGVYRLVVAMYHDQGLAAFKMLYLADGVNVTLGLPVVRTSPDHGTAFDIAGQDIADSRSMENAIKLAYDLLETGNRSA